MEHGIKHNDAYQRGGWLYPLLLIAALSVLIFSAYGVAMMTGLLPRAESITIKHNETVPKAAPVEQGTAPRIQTGTVQGGGVTCDRCPT